MRIRRTLAVVMTFLMMMSMLPTMVFASEDAVQLAGELKLKGTADGRIQTGNVLSADLSKLLPEGITEEMVTFLWEQIDASEVEEQKAFPAEDRVYTTLKELGREKEYTVGEELVGFDIRLTVTAKEESGFTGALSVITDPVTAAASDEVLDASFTEEPGDDPYEEILSTGDDPEEPDTDTADQVILTDGPEENYGENVSQSEAYPDDSESEDSIYDSIFEGFSSDSNEEEDLSDPVREEETASAPYDGTESDSSFYQEPDDVIIVTTSESYESEKEETADVLPAYPEEGSEDPVFELTVDTEKVDFGTLQTSEDSSYYAEQAQVVEVTNTGDEPLNFDEIAPEHFMVADIEETLEPADTVNLWIQPRAGLTPGTYTDTISYVSLEGAEVSYEATVVIEAPQAEQTEEDDVDDGEASEVDPADEILTPVAASEAAGTENGTESSAVLTDEQAVTETADSNASAAVVTTGSENTEQTNTETTAPENTENTEIENTETENTETNNPETGNPETENSDTVNTDTEVDNPDNTETDTPQDPENDPENDPEKEETPEDPVISLEFTDEVYAALDFGQAEEDYTVTPEPQKAELINNGNVSITLAVPYSSYGYYKVAYTDEDLTLEPGEKISFIIQPDTGLAAGDYADYVNYYLKDAEDAILTTKVAFRVTEKKPEEKIVKLVRIQAPSAVKGLPNGTAKDASSLGLPASVVIETSEGEQAAAVQWNVQDSSYKADAKIAQTFQVAGTVTLPEGVSNPDKVSLQTAVTVSVNEYHRSPITVSASENAITGIANNGEYPAQQGIRFQAVGAGMDNKDPQTGDQRYLPLSCTVVKTYTWESAPYEATIRLSNPGDYTLKVVFSLQEYTENGWVNIADAQDTKTVNFRVVSTDPTATPTITPTPAGKQAVATGDNTRIFPFVLALVVAAAAAVFAIRKKK